MKPPIDFAILNTIFNGLGDKTFNLDVLRLYDRALAATSCGVVISDMSQSEEPIIYCNPAFEKITGYPREETIGRNCRFLQGEETDPIAVDTIRQAISAGKECQVILINYRKDGTPFWNELTLSPVRDDTGQVTHYIGIQYDISDRKQKEQMQRLMQFSIDRAADAAFYIAPNGTFLYVNEAACRFLGYSRQEFLMLNASDINPLMSGKYWERHWRELKRSQSLTFETTQQTKEGRIIPVEINANYLEFNEQEYSCVFARDISDRYQSQAALKRSEELYRTLAENIPNSVVLLFDRNLHYILAEGKGLEDVNLSKETVEGKALCQVFPPEVCEAFTPAYHAALNGESNSCEYQYLNRHFLVQICPVTDETGKISGGMAMTTDITQQKQTESQLRNLVKREKLVGEIAQRIRQSLNLDDVLNTAVHEVRRLLNTDRVILYRFEPDWSGHVVVESVDSPWKSTIGMQIEDNCFQQTHAPLYQTGRVRAIDDIFNANLTPCHINLLRQCQVKANLVVPVLQGEKLWGLLIAHHCRSSRHWEDSEVQLLKQLSIQLAIAIQQAALFEQVEAELKERAIAEAALRRSEAQLKEQTKQLETAFRELQQTQAQLIQSEKMSSLGQLVAGIAHEINNPVNFICGNISHASDYTKDLLELVELYREHYPEVHPEIETKVEEIELDYLIEDFPKLLDSMQIGTKRIRQIVLSLRNFSRLDEAECKSADIHEGIENTLMILQHRLKSETQSIELQKEYGELPKVECYPGELNQVFINLISNAIDALEEQQATSPDKIPTLKISTEATHSNSVIIRIADNGMGISNQVKQQIFDPFFSTKPVGKGTGLGLSISYKIIVERHQGKLDCISEVGKGTEFIIEIPLYSAEKTKEAKSPSMAESTSN